MARQLNAGFVIEGSVRKAASNIRITVQLIDAATGHHIWAERYDRIFSDVFELQDEVRAHIIDALELQLSPIEMARLTEQNTSSVEAFDAYLRGLELLRSRRGLDYDKNLAARSAFEEAIRIDPNYA